MTHHTFEARFLSQFLWSKEISVNNSEFDEEYQMYPKPPFLKSSNNDIDHVTVYDLVVTSYFCIWLFTLDDCVFSQPLTLDVNHRSVSHRDIVYGDQSAYHNLSVLGEKSSSEEGYVLKPEEMTVLPYRLVQKDVFCSLKQDGLPKENKSFSDLKSIAKTNCR